MNLQIQIEAYSLAESIVDSSNLDVYDLVKEISEYSDDPTSDAYIIRAVLDTYLKGEKSFESLLKEIEPSLKLLGDINGI